jgi:hypothetical protein
VTGLCLLSPCSLTDVWFGLHYSGFQASCHSIYNNHLMRHEATSFT